MKHLLSIILFFTIVTTYAQVRISGKVSDPSGSPIPMASVILLDTYDGATANVDGYFEFETIETGAQVLVIRSVGFHDYQMPVTLDKKSLSFEIKLKEQINELQAVTISAGSFTASDESRRTVFRAIDIATTAGATADIAGALNTLPGTQKVGESGRLFVRGGDGSETKTFIDGTVVLDAYSPSSPNTPSRGRFLPFMFKGTSFSTGGYSAEYGQALSSALALDSKDQAEMTRTDIGILSVGADVAHTQAWKTGSVAGKIQQTNLRPYMKLIDQRVDWKEMPSSLELVTAFRQKVGKTGLVKFYGNFNDSKFFLYNHDIDNYDQKQLYTLVNKYRYANGFYKNMLNNNWMIRSGVSYTDQTNNITVNGNPVHERERGLHAKSVVEGNLAEGLELKTGTELISREYTREVTNLTNQFTENIFAAFAETDIYATNSFVARLGARTEYNTLINRASVDPRISVAYKTGSSGQVSMAYGKFRQSPKNDWLRLNQTLASEKATHYILSYQRVENDRTFRVESYYKKYDNLAKFDNTDINNSGSGYARGFEFFWRDNRSIKNADYWISYSFLDTKRNYLSFPSSAVPSFASKHNLSLVYKHFVSKLKSQLGTTYSITSGRPYNNPNQSVFNGEKTPYYADLSFNWSYLPRPYLIIYLSCTNLLGRNNIFGYQYSNQLNEDGTYHSRAIQQPAPRFLFVGIFITLSKEKSVNQLPVL